MASHRSDADFVAEVLSRRAEGHAQLTEPVSEALRQTVLGRTSKLLDDWETIARQQNEFGAGLQYQREDGGKGDPPLLFTPMDPELRKQMPPRSNFKAQRSLRDVEPKVNLWVKTLDGQHIEEEV